MKTLIIILSLLIVSIFSPACSVKNDDCARDFNQNYRKPNPVEACSYLAELCPKRLAAIDGLTCENQVKLSTPPSNVTNYNKTAHNVEYGYGKNPGCIGNLYHSKECYKEGTDFCKELKVACECGKLYGMTHYPYKPNVGDTSCNSHLKDLGM